MRNDRHPDMALRSHQATSSIGDWTWRMLPAITAAAIEGATLNTQLLATLEDVPKGLIPDQNVDIYTLVFTLVSDCNDTPVASSAATTCEPPLLNEQEAWNGHIKVNVDKWQLAWPRQ